MPVKDRFLKKQIKSNFSLLIFFLIILYFKSTASEEIGLKVENYIKNLNFFSSQFIQSDGNSVEEGYIYINDNKIRLDYFNPNRTLIFSEKKGVYINHELKEEQFFSTEKNALKVFYDIFLSDNFFSSSIYEKKNGGILFKKIVLIIRAKLF